MNEKQLLEIIKGGEAQTTEFKRNSDKDVGKTICAFSNSSGGILLIGVEDNGTICGIENRKSDEIQQQIYHSQQDCSPAPICSIIPVDTREGRVLAVKVPQLGSGVCYYKNEIYVRVGTTDHKIAGPAIEDFLKKRQVLSFEDEYIDAKISDLDVDKIKKYIANRNPTIPFEESKLKSILCTLKVATTNGEFRLKKSAILMFSMDPSKFITQNQMKLAKFRGTIAADVMDSATVSKPLIENIEETMGFILKNIKKAYRIEAIRREEILEYPLVAIRESVVNAIVHRDYYSPAATQINIFDDRIEITNPGALPRELKVENLPFLGLGIPRNPTLYRLLSDVNIVEGLGTGFPRMFNAMRSAGLPDPQPEDLGTIFKLTLFNRFPSAGRGGLNQRQQYALGYVREHKVITSRKYIELYKVSLPTAVADLKNLMKRGLLQKIGRGRATHYIIQKR